MKWADLWDTTDSPDAVCWSVQHSWLSWWSELISKICEISLPYACHLFIISPPSCSFTKFVWVVVHDSMHDPRYQNQAVLSTLRSCYTAINASIVKYIAWNSHATHKHKFTKWHFAQISKITKIWYSYKFRFWSSMKRQVIVVLGI